MNTYKKNENTKPLVAKYTPKMGGGVTGGWPHRCPVRHAWTAAVSPGLSLAFNILEVWSLFRSRNVVAFPWSAWTVGASQELHWDSK